MLHQIMEGIGWACCACAFATLICLSFAQRDDESEFGYDSEFPEPAVRQRSAGQRFADQDQEI